MTFHETFYETFIGVCAVEKLSLSFTEVVCGVVVDLLQVFHIYVSWKLTIYLLHNTWFLRIMGKNHTFGAQVKNGIW